MTVSNPPKKGLANPTNVIILLLSIVVFGLGIQISISNQHFAAMHQEILTMANQIKTLQESDHDQNLVLLHKILNATGRPH